MVFLNRLRRITFFCYLFVIINLYANDINQQEQNIIKQQERMLDLYKKQQEQNYINRELESANKRDKLIQQEQENKENATQKVYFFKSIVLSNFSVSDELKNDIFTYIERNLSAEDILEIIQKTTNYFVAKGYTTSIATIKKIDDEKKELILEMKWGYVDEIYLNDKEKAWQILFGIPLKNNDKFNIFALDQGLDNLNNSSYFHNIQIKPSHKDGYSNIFIYDNFYAYGLNVSLDNSSSEDRGAFRLNIGYTQNNILNLNDSLNLFFIHRFIKQPRDNKENIYVLNYSIPFFYIKLLYSLQYSSSNYRLTPSISNANDSLRHKVDLFWVIYRSQINKISLYANTSIKDNTNKIGDSRLESSSGRYTNISAGLEMISRIFNGSLFFNIEYQMGVPYLGAKKNSPQSIYDFEYRKFLFNLVYQKYIFSNQTLGISYKTSLSGSYSPKTLLTNDKMLVGDEYSVRGFKESSVAWDYGIYMNNTFSLTFLEPYSYLDFEPFIGLDFAYGRDYLLPNDTLVGVAVGIQYRLKNFSLSLTCSHALHKSSNMPDESMPFYLRASFAI